MLGHPKRYGINFWSKHFLPIFDPFSVGAHGPKHHKRDWLNRYLTSKPHLVLCFGHSEGCSFDESCARAQRDYPALDTFSFVYFAWFTQQLFSQYSVTCLDERREDSSRTQEGLDILDASQLPQIETWCAVQCALRVPRVQL